jgi:hypothetical protein
MTVQDTWNAFSDILAAAAQRLELAAALVDIEGDCAEDAGDLNRVFSQFPFLSIGVATVPAPPACPVIKTFREKNGKADFYQGSGLIAHA